MSSLRTWRLTRNVLAAIAAFTLAGLTSATTISAQDPNSDVATCVSPGVLPGTATAAEAGALPDSGQVMDVGTPVTMEPPAAPGLPSGAAADPGVDGLIRLTIENFITCYNEGQTSGDPGLYVALQSEDYLLTTTGPRTRTMRLPASRKDNQRPLSLCRSAIK